jgi:hypothetical protein
MCDAPACQAMPVLDGHPLLEPRAHHPRKDPTMSRLAPRSSHSARSTSSGGVVTAAVLAQAAAGDGAPLTLAVWSLLRAGLRRSRVAQQDEAGLATSRLEVVVDALCSGRVAQGKEDNYVLRCAHTLAINHHRQQKLALARCSNVDGDELFGEDEPDAERLLLRFEERRAVREALERLREADRALLQRVYLEEVPVDTLVDEQLAPRSGECDAGSWERARATLYKRLERARLRLRAALEIHA